MAVTLTFGQDNVKELVAKAQAHAAHIQLAYANE
jgi:hypothetical protein